MSPEIVARGPARIVAFAVCGSGAMPAKEFLSGLTVDDHAKFLADFQLSANGGRFQLRHQKGAIWSFNCKHLHIACFQVGDTWYLTHGFVEDGECWPSAELIRAEELMQEHLALC